MLKDDRSPINPFTGKEHYDAVNDDEFLAMCFNSYYKDIGQYELLDETEVGQTIINIALCLIETVDDYLIEINRYDYVENYYEWEVHLVNSEIINACCFPGGKIIVYGGILNIADTEERLAFILAHEMAHALLDHTRTRVSFDQTKNDIVKLSKIGSLAFDILGYDNAGAVARSAINTIDIGSDLLLTRPWGRDQEYEADKLGMMIIHLAGYDVKEVPPFWEEFGDVNDTFDFFSTHPSDSKRLAVMEESLNEILNEMDFYSKPLLPETPSPKNEYRKSSTTPQIPTETNNPQAVEASAFTATNIKSNRTCITCGSILNPEDKFCKVCGNKIKTTTLEVCSKCGHTHKKEDKFCMRCGMKLSPTNTCPVCGTEIKKGQVFCMRCGNKL